MRDKTSLTVSSCPSGTGAEVTGRRMTSEQRSAGLFTEAVGSMRDSQFKFVRWCSDFEVVDLASQRVVGALSKGGKEGHLSDREAIAKVVRVMQ